MSVQGTKDDTKEVKEVFAENLRRLRKLCRYTRQELAEYSGLNYSVIFCYETADTSPCLKNVIALAKALEVSIDELVLL